MTRENAFDDKFRKKLKKVIALPLERIDCLGYQAHNNFIFTEEQIAEVSLQKTRHIIWLASESHRLTSNNSLLVWLHLLATPTFTSNFILSASWGPHPTSSPAKMTQAHSYRKLLWNKYGGRLVLVCYLRLSRDMGSRVRCDSRFNPSLKEEINNNLCFYVC